MVDLPDQEVWTVLLGVALPPLIAVVNQRHWSPKLRALVALAVCWVVSAAWVALHGRLDWHHWRDTALVVTVAAVGAYRIFWQPSTIAPAIESATSTRPVDPVTPPPQ